jgi:hypothetical protein
MANQEKLHPSDDGQVIREIIPGGYAKREYKIYPNKASARIVQIFERSRFLPNFLVPLIDDGKQVDSNCLSDYPTDELVTVPQTSTEETLLSDTIGGWRERYQEVSHA